MSLLAAVGHALWVSLTMLWEIFWGLSFGFLVSALAEVMVSKSSMSRLLPDASPRSLTIAGLLGAASSSCSYAAVAMARTVVRKGGNFTAAMAFQFAATNLVLELSVLMWLLLGWQFAAAELIGAPIMILIVALLFWAWLSTALRDTAVAKAGEGVAGSMEGHASMAMSAPQGRWTERLTSKAGWIRVSHSYVMTWTMLWRDIGVGLLIAGALSAWVPNTFWQTLFMTDRPTWAAVWGAFIGPLIAVASFTCSVGNVPLAAVLWRGGMSFGGVIGFIFGDLIILPILNIYRKYYGGRMTVLMACTFYLAMVASALIIEGVFRYFNLIPTAHHAAIANAGIRFNYTSVLDLLLGLVFMTLVIVFFRTGGPSMMKMMADPHHGEHEHAHMGHHDHQHAQKP